MSRLLAFGCSYTYGQGLEEHKKITSNPSSLAWPSRLANFLNLSCYNLSVPGASNKLIWYKAIKEKYSKDDTVIFLWTHLNRSSIIRNNGTVLNIGPWSKGNIEKTYYKFYHNEYQSNLDLNMRMSQISLYLDNLGIRNYHTLAVDKEVDILDFNKAKILKTSFHTIRGRHGLALDNGHPDSKAQEEFATSLYNELKEIHNEATIQ